MNKTCFEKASPFNVLPVTCVFSSEITGTWEYSRFILHSVHDSASHIHNSLQQGSTDQKETYSKYLLQWYGHVSCSSGLVKTIFQGTVKGGRRQGRQRKRWEDNIREWTGLVFGKSKRAVENGKNGENWLQNHLWCPNDPRG